MEMLEGLFYILVRNYLWTALAVAVIAAVMFAVFIPNDDSSKGEGVMMAIWIGLLWPMVIPFIVGILLLLLLALPWYIAIYCKYLFVCWIGQSRVAVEQKENSH
jgi:hypothetical protein